MKESKLSQEGIAIESLAAFKNQCGVLLDVENFIAQLK